MRHRKLSRRFSRTSSHRTAMMRNLAISLIEHEIVKTTVEKGKYLRTFLEPLITKSKKQRRIWNYYVLGVPKEKIAPKLEENRIFVMATIKILQKEYLSRILMEKIPYL